MPDAHIFDDRDNRLYVFTARSKHHDYGMIVSWVTISTLALGKIRIVAALSPKNATTQAILREKNFSVNLLAREQFGYVPIFGLTSSENTDKFDGIAFTRDQADSPILADTCGWASCTLMRLLDVGDRIIIYADVLNYETDPSKTPLLQSKAFASLPENVVTQLSEKYRVDVLRDAALVIQS